MRLRLLWGALALCILGLASSAAAQGYAVRLDTGGARCFLYRGFAYVPLRNVARFLGADLTWGEDSNHVAIGLADNTLEVTIGSTDAVSNGSPVELPVPPVAVNDVAMVPVTIFHDFFLVDVDWDPTRDRAFIYGPEGWGYCDVLPYTPSYVTGLMQSYGGPIFNPSPFFLNGVPFVPLADWAGFLGFPVFFEPDLDDFVLIARGREIVFFIGRPTVFFGNESFLLPASPIIVANRAFVPLSFFALDPIGAPVEVIGNIVRVTGPRGVRQVRVLPRPPARVVMVAPRQSQRLGIPMRPERIPGVLTPTPRPQMRAGRPVVPPLGPTVRPLPRGVVTPPGVAVRPLEPMVPAPRPGRPAPGMVARRGLAAAPPAERSESRAQPREERPPTQPAPRGPQAEKKPGAAPRRGR